MKKIITSIFCLAAALEIQAQTFNFPANYNTNFADVDNPTFAEMNGEIYFFAARTNFDYEPHKYNCSTSTYTLLKDVNPGAASSEPYNGANDMIKFKNHVYFGALDGTGKTDLWRTDGTTAGTEKFKTFAFTGSDPQTITFFAADDNLLYFRAAINAGYGIWRTDGTDAGTFLISQATNFNYYVSEKKEETVLHNGKFYFQQKLLPSSFISLPFASDGTVAGTVSLVESGNPQGYYMTDPYDFEVFQDKVWFGLNGPTGGGLFKSDGSLAGTKNMGSMGTGAEAALSPTNLKAAGNYLYARALGSKGNELYYTNGTLNGGGLVADVWPGGNGGLQATSEFCAVGDKLFFTSIGSASDSKPELYVANGISGATRLDVSGTTEESKPQFLVSYGNLLYFRAKTTSSSASQRVYKSDGTVAGTVDAAPGATYFFTGGAIFALPSGIYFPATVNGNDLRPANIGNCFLATAIESEVSNKVEIYPNPTQNELTIHGVKGNEKVWLMDFQGRTVLEKQMDGVDGKLNLSNLPNGMYVLGLQSGKREKIVKN